MLGVAASGNWNVQHDDAVTEVTLVGSTTRSTLTGSFFDPIRLTHVLTGSTSSVILENAHFENGIITNIQACDGATNRIAYAEVNTTFDGVSQTMIEGGSGGSDLVLIAGAGVDNQGGKTLVLDLKDGDNTVVIAETNHGQGAGVPDSVAITADAGSTNVLVYSAEDNLSPADQLDQLETTSPSWPTRSR